MLATPLAHFFQNRKASKGALLQVPSFLAILSGREPGRCTQRRSKEERDRVGTMRCGELRGTTGSRSLGRRAEQWWYLGWEAVCPAHSVFIPWAIPAHMLAELDGVMF